MAVETPSTRERVLRAAADLLSEGGREAVSTRAVGAAAGVQAPTLYRLFGDKDGLLAAVAAHGFERYLADKVAMERTGDPVTDLRRGWDLHVRFGLSQPAFYTLMYGDARPDTDSPAAREASKLLRGLVERIAAAGRLKVPVDRAARVVHAAGVGVTLSLIAAAPEERDPELSPMTREAVLAAITTAEAPPADGPAPHAPPPEGHGTTGDRAAVLAARAVALQAALPDRDPRLTPAEQALLTEWLDRLSH
ncbi:TetR family transcriptional regulator [Sphaerisporangium melleum]|uniref:TetR family transcriptional regulator n=1 Tax=Sphaerisporangium melleum TaxID=321316 RepID=A0A917VJC6_9ACTN|nr:TetR/AcrR family transcriptional regulator [Sphaerisporangium melleum]GGK90667.1 TetR family transcriptional regulator [Sphaerisporangium melleum]GII72834.1 TetR family transcriptional regulator [Sphaerisporangium melleum]